ncbi:hypothetical protein M569_08713, partial [Genlisea aurea]
SLRSRIGNRTHPRLTEFTQLSPQGRIRILSESPLGNEIRPHLRSLMHSAAADSKNGWSDIEALMPPEKRLLRLDHTTKLILKLICQVRLLLACIVGYVKGIPPPRQQDRRS